MEGDSAEEAELVEPGEALASRPFVALPDGSAEFQYDLWMLIEASGASIQCILVSRVADGRYLVAFPHQVWHRTVSKRTLPPVLSKATLIEVVCASVEDMTQEQAFYMKVWVGYITAETFGEMVVLRDASEAVNYPFLYEESDGYLPFAPALIEALEERFSFLSAESGRGGEDGSAALGEPLGALGPRVSRLEDLLGKMSVSLETVLEKVSTGSSKPSTPKVQFAAKPKVIPGAHRQEGAAKFPSLDPSVVASALSAGVPEENLREMERLMGASSKGKKLREPALRKPARKVAEGVLSESEDEVEEAESGSPTTAAQEPGTMEGALSKLTELVTLLSADKIKRAKSSKVDIALENLGANTGGDSSTGSTGKRAAAGRRALRLALQEAPEDISNVIEKLILEDLTLQTVMPGMPKKDFNARAWVEHRSRIGAYKSSAYLLGSWTTW